MWQPISGSISNSNKINHVYRIENKQLLLFDLVTSGHVSYEQILLRRVCHIDHKWAIDWVEWRVCSVRSVQFFFYLSFGFSLLHSYFRRQGVCCCRCFLFIILTVLASPHSIGLRLTVNDQMSIWVTNSLQEKISSLRPIRPINRKKYMENKLWIVANCAFL